MTTGYRTVANAYRDTVLKAAENTVIMETRVHWIKDTLRLPDDRYDDVIRATLRQCPNMHWATERMRAWLSMGIK